MSVLAFSSAIPVNDQWYCKVTENTLRNNTGRAIELIGSCLCNRDFMKWSSGQEQLRPPPHGVPVTAGLRAPTSRGPAAPAPAPAPATGRGSSHRAAPGRPVRALWAAGCGSAGVLSTVRKQEDPKGDKGPPRKQGGRGEATPGAGALPPPCRDLWTYVTILSIPGKLLASLVV